jgi:hypothetical protein
MSRQHVEFKVTGTDKDSGEADLTAIKPVADGEPGQAAVFKRPSENLRTRTEFMRAELENLKYMSEADRALLLTSAGNITWNGVGTGTFSISGPSSVMTLKPFIAPNVSTAGRLIIGLGSASQITIRTRQNHVLGQPRAYSGANDFSFDFTPVDTGTGVVVITVDGTPANNFHVQYDSNVTSGTTVQQMLNYLNNVTPTAGGAAFITAGLEAVVEGGLGPNGGPVEVGYPTPLSPLVGNKVIVYGTPPPGTPTNEFATRFLAGAADAEKHIISDAQLTSFFTAEPTYGYPNKLIEGDVLCVRYDDLVMNSTGGRRQSINELPENKAIDAGANLFLLRRFPERLPGSLPVATVVDGKLIFVNGRVFGSGESGPLVSSGASYQGSKANPDSWANSTGIAAGSFEDALDSVIQALGSITATSGAHVLGIDAIAGVGAAPGTFSTAAGTLKQAVSSIVTGANAHINLATAAHAATAVSATATATGTSFNTTSLQVQGAIADVALGFGTHKDATASAHAATAISNTAAGSIVATTVQAAINELDTNKVSHSLTANLIYSPTPLALSKFIHPATFTSYQNGGTSTVFTNRGSQPHQTYVTVTSGYLILYATCHLPLNAVITGFEIVLAGSGVPAGNIRIERDVWSVYSGDIYPSDAFSSTWTMPTIPADITPRIYTYPGTFSAYNTVPKSDTVICVEITFNAFSGQASCGGVLLKYTMADLVPL